MLQLHALSPLLSFLSSFSYMHILTHPELSLKENCIHL
ncbi:hypothetical protein V529_36430 [Bacillus velezensis SQR9]|nr:hypothetical protein V529_36430 [Bacillus velezensis SQR9]